MSTPTFIAPPAPTEADPAAAGGDGGQGNETLTMEQAAAEIERLRSENGTLKNDVDKWTKLSRKHETEAKKLKGGGQQAPADPAAGGTPSGPSSSDLKAQRLEIALELGLPLSLARRLQGDDEDSIRADAEDLLKLVKPAEPTTPKFQGGADGGTGGGSESKGKSFDDWVREEAGIRRRGV